ncbi:MAG TPA: sugar transferase [Pseudonocardia sp.]
MLPDPALGRIPDPTPAAGYGDRRTEPRSVRSPQRLRGLAVKRPAWEGRYVRAVIVSDAAAVTATCTAAVLFSPLSTDLGNSLLSAVIGPAVALLLLVAISLAGAVDLAVLGAGSAEYRRLVRGCAAAGIGLGLVGLATGLENVRSWVFGVMPAACLLAVLGRITLRKALRRRRARGECTRTVLAVGTADAVADLISRTRRNPHHGWVVTGACTPTGAGLDGTDAVLGVPVIGDLDDVAKVARRGRQHIVSISVTPGWSPARLHRLADNIREVGVELMVDPQLIEVAGPRLHVEPMDGLPLLRLTQPALRGASLLVKGLVDRLAAALLLVLLAPLMLGLAVAIRSDGGPALRRETRVGRGGEPFGLLRFRSTDAAAGLGTWVRRYGLDGLPQLFNVLGGSMSLVGPRPARPAETAGYAADLRAAHIVRPGLTGLWQSDGSVDLTPEETAQLTLRYVQHWSLIQDVVIAWRAVTTAARPSADY